MNFDEFSADLNAEPITGFLPDGRHLNIPLISKITNSLHVGGCIHDVDLGDYFDAVFSLYKWERYRMSDSTDFSEVTMYDSPGYVDAETVEAVSDAVCARMMHDQKVLVHCQAGINRSNMVAARAMMKAWDITGAKAIDILSANRSDAILANTTFRDYVLGFDK